MRGDSGLTLLELLVVLAILGFASSLGAIAYGGRSSRMADRLLEDAQMLLRAARREAVDSGHPVRISLSGQVPTSRPANSATVDLHSRSLVQAHARWRSADKLRDEPVFYPDGSATPGAIDFEIVGRHRRIEIGWEGGLRDLATDQ